MTSSGIEPATFLLVVYCLNQVHNRLPHLEGYWKMILRWTLGRSVIIVERKCIWHSI
jgi:hypothetical protein